MAETEPPAAAEASASVATIQKLSLQLKRLNDANVKYKNLLKLAKERITKQEEELTASKASISNLEERIQKEEKEAASRIVLEDEADENVTITEVCQRLKLRNRNGEEVIWALLEMEATNDEKDTRRCYPLWRSFVSESELSDFIRRDTGEPLVLPPYSLSPEQSKQIQDEAAQQVSKVTEEFRRFRVRSELARKQADAQIRDLQSVKVQRVARRITEADGSSPTGSNGESERLRVEMAAQEAHWKEAYDMLVAENKALKSSGSEAMLAAQWRQRYEQCAKEKEELELSKEDDPVKYEAKYRDLKESFRLYRKKAKEIFEEQNQNSSAGSVARPKAPTGPLSISSNSSADAKLSYLRNLMVNYFTADLTMRDHMQSAIGTVLQFNAEELKRIEKKKVESEAWF